MFSYELTILSTHSMLKAPKTLQIEMMFSQLLYLSLPQDLGRKGLAHFSIFLQICDFFGHYPVW